MSAPRKSAKRRDFTADMFAQGGGEDLQLAPEVQPDNETFAQRCARAAALLARDEPEQSVMF